MCFAVPLEIMNVWMINHEKEKKKGNLKEMKRSSCKNKLGLEWWEHLLGLHCGLELCCIPRKPVRASGFVRDSRCKLINKVCKVNSGFSFSYSESHGTGHLRMIHWLLFILNRKSMWDQQQMTFALIQSKLPNNECTYGKVQLTHIAAMRSNLLWSNFS